MLAVTWVQLLSKHLANNKHFQQFALKTVQGGQKAKAAAEKIAAQAKATASGIETEGAQKAAIASAGSFPFRVYSCSSVLPVRLKLLCALHLQVLARPRPGQRRARQACAQWRSG
jgi:hypothetical protein